MAIEIINNTILRPSPSSSHPLHNTLVPLTIFDRAAFDLHVPTIYAFRAPMPTNESLKEGLSKVLLHFPHLTGRMVLDDHLRPCFLLNNAGIRLIETRVESTLAEKMPLNESKELSNLHPPTEGVEELLQIQLNRYACGGLVIGATSHHRVADGQSMSGFLVQWAEMVRGTNVDPSPYLDRAAISLPRNPPRCEFNHREIEFKESVIPTTTPTIASCTIENLVVHYSAEFITNLKSIVLDENNVRSLRCSTFECLLAHLWKKLTMARQLGDDEHTQVRVAVNGRTRMKPSVPMEYFGNMVLWAYPRLIAKELLEKSHAHAVQAIHEAVAGIDDAYFRSFIDFGELWKGEEEREELVATAPETGNMLCPNMEVDSWLRFNFHDLDFGSGGPCAFLPPNLPVEGLMVFVPSCKEKGGVDVFLALSQDHVDLFKQICYSLD